MSIPDRNIPHYLDDDFGLCYDPGMEYETPPFVITPEILNLCTEITALIGKYEGLQTPLPEVKLRKENQIKTIQGTVAIEGNTLSTEQITAVLEGKPVKGSQREITEVKNAIQAYQHIKQFNLLSMEDFLNAHKSLMNGLIPDAGKFRSKAVGIIRQDGLAHIAPPAHLVPTHMNNLFQFLKLDSRHHPLIKASVFHYELEFIHPFPDGNGRIGRLWQHALLIKWKPVFESISIEGIVKQRQQEYYKALEQSDKKGSCEDFITFDLSAILQALNQFLANVM